MIQKIDQLVSNYNIEQAKVEFQKVSWDKTPRELCASAASLARRLDNPKGALKILHNNIYGTESPTPADIIEYSSSLRTLGLINQALTLLDRVPPTTTVHLHKAFCYITQWDYDLALEELDNYIKDPSLTKKQFLLAQVNRATCLIECDRLHNFLQFIQPLEKEAQKLSPHLYINILEIKAQFFIKEDESQKAIEVLDQALELAQQQEHTTNLFLKKWQLIAKCKNKTLDVASEEVELFRKEIRKAAQWETLRDFDYHLSQLSDNKNLMNYVFYGTPFRGYRKTIIKQNSNRSWDEKYIWKNKKSKDSSLDLLSGDRKSTPFGLGLHRLWMILSSDFYSPWSVPRIFNSLFPDEVFHPVSSPKRVYRLIQQLTQIIESEALQVNLNSTVHGYRLKRLNRQFL
ncbi:MAG: hypothetical protein MJK18_05310 [Bdellovibrionales bacterium]|nr:hypothetical protein [Bdellovibrionales bacterium]